MGKYLKFKMNNIKMPEINLKTTMPLGLVAVFLGGAFWLATLHWLTLETAAAVKVLQTENKIIGEKVVSIETKVDILLLRNEEKK